MAELLVKHAAAPNTVGTWQTALEVAESKGHGEIAAMLRERGASPEIGERLVAAHAAGPAGNDLRAGPWIKLGMQLRGVERDYQKLGTEAERFIGAGNSAGRTLETSDTNWHRDPGGRFLIGVYVRRS